MAQNRGINQEMHRINYQSQNRKKIYVVTIFYRIYKHLFAFVIVSIYLLLLDNFKYILKWQRCRGVNKCIKLVDEYSKSVK